MCKILVKICNVWQVSSLLWQSWSNTCQRTASDMCIKTLSQWIINLYCSVTKWFYVWQNPHLMESGVSDSRSINRLIDESECSRRINPMILILKPNLQGPRYMLYLLYSIAVLFEPLCYTCLVLTSNEAWRLGCVCGQPSKKHECSIGTSTTGEKITGIGSIS